MKRKAETVVEATTPVVNKAEELLGEIRDLLQHKK
jgi:large-conductance mechanosensitive channel